MRTELQTAKGGFTEAQIENLYDTVRSWVDLLGG
jgi:hypothetical protein